MGDPSRRQSLEVAEQEGVAVDLGELGHELDDLAAELLLGEELLRLRDPRRRRALVVLPPGLAALAVPDQVADDHREPAPEGTRSLGRPPHRLQARLLGHVAGRLVIAEEAPRQGLEEALLGHELLHLHLRYRAHSAIGDTRRAGSGSKFRALPAQIAQLGFEPGVWSAEIFSAERSWSP